MNNVGEKSFDHWAFRYDGHLTVTHILKRAHDTTATAPQEEMGPFRKAIQAVSYTHLTLPTNREV